MKRKIFSILFATILLLSMSLVTAAPVAAVSVTQTVTGDGAGGFTLAEMDQQFSTATIDASASNTTLSGSVTLGNFDNGNGDDVWYEAGLVSDETYLGYSRLHNKGVYMIALWSESTGYIAHVQNVVGQQPQNTGNYLADEGGYVDTWGDAGKGYFQIPGATFDYELRYHDVTDSGGNVDLRISVDAGTTWSGWKLYQYTEDDMESFYGWSHEDAVASGYATDDDLTNARIVSQIFVCSTTTATFTADYDNIAVDGTPYELSPRVVNTDTGDGYTAIQLAIDVANSNDTINVAAGTYTENITIDKILTLEGAQAGVNARGRTGPESIINAQGVPIAVLINGADTVATIDGFTVENYDTIGILAGAFRDVLQEVTLGDDPLAVHILNNIVNPPTVAPPHNNNIQVGDGTTGTIIGNDVSGALLESPDWSGTGILVASSSNVLVSYNYVHNSEGGIAITGYLGYQDRDAPAVDNVIEYNLVEDNESGIIPQTYSIGTIIRYNDVLNNDEGIAVMGIDYNSWTEHIAPSGTEVHHNNIVGNGEGVVSGVWGSDTGVLAEEVDATNNWWNHASGPVPPGTYESYGDAVSDNVDFKPWLLEEVVPGVEPTTYDKTLALKDGWTLISIDTLADELNRTWEGTTLAAYKYTPAGFVDATLADLEPLTAIYVKTDGGGGVGFNCTEVAPAVYAKDLETGWNLISIPSKDATTGAILSPLRYVTIGTQQGVGLATLVSQGDYNQFSDSFYLATLTDADWDALVPLNPLDGYWAYMNAAKTFEVIPD